MGKLNITKRNGGYQYRFEIAKVDGKRKQVSKSGFKTKKEAEIAGTKAMAEYNNSGQAFTPSTISVADYLDFWMDTYVKMNLAYNTQLAYLNIVENHLKPNLGFYRLQQLQAATIQEYVNGLKLKGLSRSHSYGISTTLLSALQYAVEPLHYIQFNPCSYVKFPKFNENKADKRFILSMEDFNRIIERFKEPSPFYVPLMIGFYTGMRVSEIFGLTWDDIDFEKRTISVNKITVKRNFDYDVRKVYQRTGKKEERSAWYFGTPKTRASTRTIKFGETLYQVLKRAKRRMQENRMRYGEYYTNIYKQPCKDEKGNIIYRLVEIPLNVDVALEKASMICIKENGDLLSVDSMKYPSRVIHHELMIAFNMHSLRHTHATLLIQNGANVKDVQARLGHADIETTLNTYVHDTEQMQQQSVDIFEKYVMHE